MEWSGRAPAPRVIEAGKERQDDNSTHIHGAHAPVEEPFHSIMLQHDPDCC